MQHEVDIEPVEQEEKARKKTIKLKKSDVYKAITEQLRGDPDNKSLLGAFPHKFHILKDKNGIHQYVRELDEQVICRISQQFVVDGVAQYYEKNISLHAADFGPDDFIKTVKFWASTTKGLAESDIVPLKFKSEPGLTWHRLPFDLVSGPHPVWDEFFERITNPLAVMAYVGSLFDPNADRQQYLWMFGQGGDGKGAFARFLTKVLSQAADWFEVPDKSGDKFWSAGFIGKRLAIFGDCSNFSFPSTGKFKSLTGGDYIRTERKYQEAYAAQLITKFFFFSNDKPLLSSKKADLRRVIYSEAKPIKGDVIPNYEDLLWQEGPAFLHSCIELYKSMCPHGGPIPNSKDQLEAVVAFAEDHYQAIWENHFVKTDDSDKPDRDRLGIDPVRMVNLLAEDGMISNVEKSRFFNWMEATYNVTRKRYRNDTGNLVWKYFGCRQKSVSEKERSNFS